VNIPTPFWVLILPFLNKILTNIALRKDASSDNLRISAYETISSFISCGAKDTVQFLTQVTPVFMRELGEALKKPLPPNNDDKEDLWDIQTGLCGVLTTITNKLGSQIVHYAGFFSFQTIDN